MLASLIGRINLSIDEGTRGRMKVVANNIAVLSVGVLRQRKYHLLPRFDIAKATRGHNEPEMRQLWNHSHTPDIARAFINPDIHQTDCQPVSYDVVSL
jgi:hypothetical protein